MDADEILVLNEGTVAERGSHRHLISQPGSLYAHLWQKQNEKALEEAAKAALNNNNQQTPLEPEQKTETQTLQWN